MCEINRVNNNVFELDKAINAINLSKRPIEKRPNNVCSNESDEDNEEMKQILIVLFHMMNDIDWIFTTVIPKYCVKDLLTLHLFVSIKEKTYKYWGILKRNWCEI